ncbi:MAG: TetR/AcrR family transcriptional regulator [Actinomycetota bacterium]
MSGDETSERIKRAALARFVEVGFGSTTVDEIAAGAGVGVATLYRRWPDKSALGNELMIDYLDLSDDLLEPVTGGTRKSRFLELWRRLWHQAKADPDLLLFVEAQASAGFMTEEVASRKEAVAQRWIDAIGDFGVEAEPTTALSMLVGTLTAVWRSGLDVDPDDLGERLWVALRAA